MTKIEHTNIIIDNFSIAKTETNRTYTHILTHIHTDHLKGLHDGWTYGPIYCTESTKALLLYKFPNIPNIITLPLQTPTEIKMSATLSVTVTFFDANHCIGGVMVLIEGYMGRVLYTGDMRFDREIFKKYSYLYPPDKQNQNFQRCSKQIDIIYLDNTFLKKKFNFPPKHAVLKMAVDYIHELLNLNQHKRVFIGLDSFGKQEVLVELATHFGMYIVVDQQRYQLIRQTPLDLELFTTNKHEGIIEIVRKDKLYFNLKEVPESIGIVLSGWVNHPTYRFNKLVYCLPYSLHSNYQEIHQFVNSIRPTYIYPIVHEFPDENRLFYAGKKEVSKKDLMFNQQLFQEEKADYKSQIQQLRVLYASPPTQDYKALSQNVQLQKKIEEQLRPPNFSNLFTSEKVTPLNMQVVERKKYRISNNRNQIEINRIKNQIKLKKKMRQGLPIQIVEDDIDGKSFEVSDNSKNITKVIAIDDQQQFQTMKEDAVEIDPLYQPINTSRSRPVGGNEKQKSRSSFPVVRESAKQLQKSIAQNIQKQIKKNQQTSKPIQIFSRIEKPLEDHPTQNINLQNEQKILEKPIGIQKPMNKTTQFQPIKRLPEKTFSEFDMDIPQPIKVLDQNQDVQIHIQRFAEQPQRVRMLLKRRQKSSQ